MKAISAKCLAALEGGAMDVVWLAALDWEDGEQRLAARPLSVGGVAFAGGLARAPELRLAAEVSAPGGAPALGMERAVVFVERRGQRAETAEGFAARLEVSAPEGRSLRLGVALPPADCPESVELEDAIWLFSGWIERVFLEPLVARIEARGGLARGALLAPAPLAPETLAAWGADPRAIVAPPLIWGRVEDCEAIPWCLRVRGRLARAMSREDRAAPLDSLEGWPPAGRAQVGDEVFEFGAVDSRARTLGSNAAPLARPEARAHTRGAAVWLLPPGGPDWIVAGHRCRRVERARVETRELSESEYSTDEIEVEEGAGTARRLRTLTRLRMDRLPAIAREAAEPVEKRLGAKECALRPLVTNQAMSVSLALDEDPGTAARLTRGAKSLRVGAGLNLAGAAGPGMTTGGRRFGRFASAALEVTLGASRLWQANSQVLVSLWRGGRSREWRIERPLASSAEAQVTLATPLDPAHALEDSRSLFNTAGENRAAVEFHEVSVEPGEGAWENAAAAIGPAGALAESGAGARFTRNGPGMGPAARLRAAALRLPLGGDGIETRAAWLCVVARGEGEGAALGVRVRPAGGPAREGEIRLSSQRNRYEWAIPGAEAQTLDTLFGPGAWVEVWLKSGEAVELRALWAEASWRLRLEGLDRSVAYAAEQPAAQAQVTAPISVAPKRYLLDFTDFALEAGGWGFFAGGSAERPEWRVDFLAQTDPAEIHVYELALRLGYFPVTSTRAVARLTVAVEGRMDAAGALITHPADLLKDLLTADDLGGEDAALLDTADWEAARAATELAGVAMRRRVAAEVALERLAGEVAGEAGLLLAREGDRWRLRTAPALPLEEDALVEITPSRALGIREAERMEASSLIASLEARISAATVSGGRRRLAWARDALAAPRAWGEQGEILPLAWIGVENGGETAARRVLERALARRSFPRERIAIELGLRWAALERGDVVRLAAADGGFPPGVAEVEGWELAEGGARILARLRLAPAARTFWEAPDGGARILRLSAGGGILFVAQGKIIARLGGGGAFQIRGSASEASLERMSQSGPFFWDSAGGALLLAPRAAGGWRAAAALTAQGDLLLAGGLEERAALGYATFDMCYKEVEGALLFSAGGTEIHARIEDAAGGLALRGELIENATLF